MAWCTIESDPGVFNEMMWNLGATGVAVEEIYSLDGIEDRSDFQSYGLIFLFKYVEEVDERPILDEEATNGLIFSRQVVTNACATQALLSVLLNAPNIDLGDELTEFKSFVSILDPESRGMAIENSDRIREVHNSFARNEPFMTEDSKHDKNAEHEDAHHFIAFLPHMGCVYELDGLKPGAIQVGTYEHPEQWLSAVKPAIVARMQRYAASETHFALLSLRPRRSHQLLKALEVVSSDNERVLLEAQLSEERAVEEQQRLENVRRRHNYVPFTVKLLQILARRGQLQPLIETARQQQRRIAQQQQSTGGN